MKARLVLWLLQALFSPRGRFALAAVLILLLVPVVLLSSVIPVTIPLVSDEQMQLYREGAEGLPVEVDWRSMLAVDAVKNKQDFSQVDLLTVTASALTFVGTESRTELWRKPIDFKARVAGEWYEWTFDLADGGEVWWDAQQIQGASRIQLLNATGQPVDAGEVEPGRYTLHVEAVQVPVECSVTLYTRTEREIQFAKPPDQVMAELGFTADEVELAHAFMQALADVV